MAQSKLGSGKRVFIIGAGFSKPAGFPLATNLTDEVLGALRDDMGDDAELFAFAGQVRILHKWIAGAQSIPPLNIEEFYEYATVFMERFRFEQHLEVVGRTSGETAYGQAESIKAWLSYLDEYLLDTLLKHEDSANLSSIARFVDALRPGDTVVTFNYDRLIERALSQRGIKWSLGFDSDSDAIRVLKMHGSLDWICFARNQRMDRKDMQRLFAKQDLNREHRVASNERSGEGEYDFELYRIHDDPSLHRWIKERDLIQRDHVWGLAGLGPCKRISQVPGLGVVWDKARRAMFEADTLAIIGFSFSIYDRLAQVEFARVMAGRAEAQSPNPKVLVIDPSLELPNCRRSRTGRALLERIGSVFRDAKAFGVRHEEFDWSNLE